MCFVNHQNMACSFILTMLSFNEQFSFIIKYNPWIFLHGLCFWWYSQIQGHLDFISCFYPEVSQHWILGWVPCSNAICWKDCIFFHWIAPLSKIIWQYLCRSVFALSIVYHWSLNIALSSWSHEFWWEADHNSYLSSALDKVSFPVASLSSVYCSLNMICLARLSS